MSSITLLKDVLSLFCFEMVMIIFLFHPGLSEDIKDLTPSELVKLAQDISGPHTSYQFQPSDVQFYLISRETPEPVLLTIENMDLLDASKKTKILIHGWIENHKRTWYKLIAEEYLQSGDYNVIEVDWEQPARLPYVYSSQLTKNVGNVVGEFILDTNIPPKNVHIIGHSLGSHVAGFAGKRVMHDAGAKVGRISGLDPAGPYFRHPSITNDARLDRNDADIVDVLHTDAGFYGYEDPIGTFDIYINGGQRIQPGCLDELRNTDSSLGAMLEKSFCSHARSTKYFKEWINKGKFKCRFCQPVIGINIYGTRCSLLRTTEALGSNDVTETTSGVCFAETNKKEPYLSN